jgi:hypothetical protein
VTPCPRCGEAAAAAQEYCLECGLRLPGAGRLGPPPQQARRFAAPLVAAGVIAAGGAAAAVALTWDPGDDGRVLTAIGGSVRAPEEQGAAQLATWPRGREGWTIVLVSLPKRDGREEALDRARLARRRGLTGVGVLDSGRVAGLHPGYWVVFTGAYATEPEATSELRRARSVSRTAATRQISA